MDGHKFDKLTRAFATGTDRRTLLKIFGGATLTGVAGVAIARPSGVFAQGTVQPGGVCATDADCAQGSCDPTGLVCYCEDPARPWIGCDCNTGTPEICGGGTAVCCTESADDPPGSAGVCTSGMAECQYAVDASCISGAEGACDAYNEANDTDYICCTYGGDPGSEGTCVSEDACVVEPPNTGAGTAADSNSWIAPAAAVGAAAAVLAYKSRERNVENEA